MIEITRVNIKKNEDSNAKVLAYADITLNDAVAIHGIKVLEGDHGEYIAFPSRKDNSNGKYYDVCHPINQETRSLISDIILDKYNTLK